MSRYHKLLMFIIRHFEHFFKCVNLVLNKNYFEKHFQSALLWSQIKCTLKKKITRVHCHILHCKLFWNFNDGTTSTYKKILWKSDGIMATYQRMQKNTSISILNLNDKKLKHPYNNNVYCIQLNLTREQV